MQLVVMGVSGAGKSTLGAAVAQALGWALVEADDLHPAANVAAMRAGRALNDAQRAPWLDAVGVRMAALEAGERDAVVCCSALKATYRARLARASGDVRFVMLGIDPPLARARVAGRSGHYMPVELVDSQFEALEPPAPCETALTLDAAAPLQANVEEVLAFVRRAAFSATPGSAC